MFKYIWKLEVSQFDVSFVISLGLHILLLVNFYPEMLKLTKDTDEKVMYEIDLNLAEQLKERQKIKIYSKEGFELEEPDLLIYRKIVEKKVLSPLDALLADIAKYDRAEVKLNRKNMLLRQNLDQIAMHNKQVTAKEAILAAAEQAKQKEQSIAYHKVKSIVSAHYSSFRGCYEQALIQDEFLSGNVTVYLGGVIDAKFKGVGQQDSIRGLKRCIKAASKKINLPTDMKGKRIKFSLFFKS